MARGGATEQAARTSFRDVFAVAEFRALWMAQLLSVVGDQLARVALTVLSPDHGGPMTPYLSITGTAHVEEGGAPELLRELAKTMIGPDAKFPPMDDPPPGFVTHITVNKIGGNGPWAG